MPFFNRVFWRPRVGTEVDDEIAFHLEMRTRDLVASGMTPDAARREAERRIGDLTKMRRELRALGGERNRSMERTEYFSELLQDVAFAARQLTKNPGFTAIAVLTLALGIGGTTSIFSLLNAVVLQPLPLAEPDRLLVVGETYQGSLSSMSAGNYVDAAGGTATVADLAALNFGSVNLSDGVTPERVSAAQVTANYFDVLGSRPEIGRVFTRKRISQAATGSSS
jgi:putative ABC transport system permease protein